MEESSSDASEEREATVANTTPICDARHCREMRKEKLPPYLRDRGTKSIYIVNSKITLIKTINMFYKKL